MEGSLWTPIKRSYNSQTSIHLKTVILY